jgi:hypothetical protein
MKTNLGKQRERETERERERRRPSELVGVEVVYTDGNHRDLEREEEGVCRRVCIYKVAARVSVSE